MVQQLVIEESRHEAVEEMYFWPAVRGALTDGDDLADQAQAQEQEAKTVLDRLDKLAPEDGEFEALLAQFTEAGREHGGVLGLIDAVVSGDRRPHRVPGTGSGHLDGTAPGKHRRAVRQARARAARLRPAARGRGRSARRATGEGAAIGV